MTDKLKQARDKYLAEHPDLKEEILDFYWLANDEIEQGASFTNEYNLFCQEIDSLIEQKRNN
jgi:hypothetical protein